MPLAPQDEEARYAARYEALNKRITELLEENRELREDKISFRGSSNQYKSDLEKAKDEIEKLRWTLNSLEEENSRLKRTVSELQDRKPPWKNWKRKESSHGFRPPPPKKQKKDEKPRFQTPNTVPAGSFQPQTPVASGSSSGIPPWRQAPISDPSNADQVDPRVTGFSVPQMHPMATFQAMPSTSPTARTVVTPPMLPAVEAPEPKEDAPRAGVSTRSMASKGQGSTNAATTKNSTQDEQSEKETHAAPAPLRRGGARTKSTARKSTGGHAPRKSIKPRTPQYLS